MAVVWNVAGPCLTRDDDVSGFFSDMGLTFEPWPILPLSTVAPDLSALLQYRHELERWQRVLNRTLVFTLSQGMDDVAAQAFAAPHCFGSPVGYFCYGGSCRFQIPNQARVDLHHGDFLLVPAAQLHQIALADEARCNLLVLVHTRRQERHDMDRWI